MSSDVSAHAQAAAYETLLLCASQSDPRTDLIIDRLRPRLGISKRHHTALRDALARAPPPPRSRPGGPEHRALIVTSVESPPEGFVERQRCLMDAVGEPLPSAPAQAHSHRSTKARPSVAPADDVILEGWLEEKAGALFRRSGWKPCYLTLTADGALVSALDESGKQARRLPLSSLSVVSLPSDNTLIIDGRQAVVLRAAPSDGGGSELLRRWADAITREACKLSLRASTSPGGSTPPPSPSIAASSSSGGGGGGGGHHEDAGGPARPAWPPHIGFVLYSALVRAAAFQPDMEAAEEGWVPEEAAEYMESLRLVRRTWANLGITRSMHACALLQETASLLASVRGDGRLEHLYYHSLEEALRDALSSFAVEAAALPAGRLDAVVEAARKMRSLARRSSMGRAGGKPSRSAAITLSSLPIDDVGEGQRALAATLIQRQLVSRLMRLRATRGEEGGDLCWWVGARLGAVVAGVAANLSERLEDYRLLDEVSTRLGGARARASMHARPPACARPQHACAPACMRPGMHAPACTPRHARPGMHPPACTLACMRRYTQRPPLPPSSPPSPHATERCCSGARACLPCPRIPPVDRRTSCLYLSAYGGRRPLPSWLCGATRPPSRMSFARPACPSPSRRASAGPTRALTCHTVGTSAPNSIGMSAPVSIGTSIRISIDTSIRTTARTRA